MSYPINMSFSQKKDSGIFLFPPNALDSIELGKGLALGNDEGFSREMKELTREAGISHLTAASGSNIQLVQSLAFPWKKLYWPLLFSQGCLILIYLWVSGSSGSLLRASWQALYATVARCLGRPILPLWSLFGVVIVGVSLGWSSGLGFWLSWLAVVSLYLSQALLSGEATNLLFPQAFQFYNTARKEVMTGSMVLLFVSSLIWWYFDEWQPQGLVSTVLSQPLTTPYLGVFLLFVLFEEGNKVAQRSLAFLSPLFAIGTFVTLHLLEFQFGVFWKGWGLVSKLPFWFLMLPVTWGLVEILRATWLLLRQRLLRSQEQLRWGW